MTSLTIAAWEKAERENQELHVEIGRLRAALQTIAEAPKWWEAQSFARRVLEEEK